MSKTLADIGEFGLIHRIQTLVAKRGVQSPDITLGMGDDAAAFRPHEGYELLVTCDTMVEGRHFLKGAITARELGKRAMVMNISDIGAMGGRPLYALVSLGLRADTLVGDVEEMYQGFIEELNPFQAAIIGGNITKSEHDLFVDITLIGEVERGALVRRSTAREGDAVLVTGYPGQAAAGLQLLLNAKGHEPFQDHPLVNAYNRPDHRAKEGRAMALSGYITSMIDISDGFLGDLGHICEESHVGVELLQKRLPVSEHLNQITLPPGKTIYDLVMGNSDDYELIITCRPQNVGDVRSVISSISPVPITEVGRVIPQSEGIQLVLLDGTKMNMIPKGWDHFNESSPKQ
ncbi:MAG: thiamine-phosphate kinase [Deltaproteobacteria bacterium]|nr:thiamine-phosphate kinase [Deltaproteobacteria bacterium]